MSDTLLAPTESELEVLADCERQEALDAERDICEGSLIEFLRAAWTHLGESGEFIVSWHHWVIADDLEAVARGEIRDVIINVPPRCTKALAIDTPILTTWGWKAHGDLRPGDFVFSPEGYPVRVIAVTPHMMRPASLVSFDDRTEIVAADDHLWSIDRDHPYGSPKGHRCRKHAVVTTSELISRANCEVRQKVGTKRQRSKFTPDRIATCRPIEMPTKRLLVDPYLLGAWLGDGSSYGAVLYVGWQDIEHFGQLGSVTEHPPGERSGNPIYHVRIPGLQRCLRVMGLINHKHIPDDYLEASIEQRWELVRGLMDTDGCATTKEGICKYVSKWEPLAQQVATLLRSLGQKPALRAATVKLNGKVCGPYYEVTFVATPDAPPIFKLQRKQALVRVAQNARSLNRYVMQVDAVGERVVNCIQVEGNLYLAGRAFVTTHNSLLVNVAFPAWVWCQPPERQRLLMGSHVKFLSVSYGATLAEDMAVKMRRLVMGEWYQERWGDRVQIQPDQQSRSNFANTAGGERFSCSIEGGIVGRGGDIQIIDDPHHVKGAESDTQRRETIEGMRALSNRITDPRRSARVMIMQRLHVDDATNYALEHWRMGLVHRWFPMRYDETRPCVADQRVEDGELLWPDVWSEESVAQEERELGPYMAAGQLAQSPQPRGGGIIKRPWWRLWPDDAERDAGYRAQYRCGFCDWSGERLQLESVIECPVCGKDAERRIVFPPTSFRLLSVDTGIGDREANSYSAATLWGVWHGKDDAPRVMLMDAWRGRPMLRGGNTGEKGLVEIIAALANRRQADTVLIERKTRGVDLYNELARLLRDYPWSLEFFEPTGRGDKSARLSSVQPLFTNELVWAPNKTWADMVINEVSEAPFSKNDDLSDTCSSALLHLRDTNRLSMSHEHAAEVRRSMVFKGRSMRFNASETFEGA